MCLMLIFCRKKDHVCKSAIDSLKMGALNLYVLALKPGLPQAYCIWPYATEY